jgi:diguanylate cyclase (GGDEF)-like protein
MKAHVAAGDVPSEPTQFLIIDRSVRDAQLLRLLLRTGPRVAVKTAHTLQKGLSSLARHRFDLVLLDLALPDGAGVEAVGSVHRAAPHVPIVAVSDGEEEAQAFGALRCGAQDWLVKSEIDQSLLRRVIRYACERQRLVAAIENLALTDNLTGLYNRNGFMAIAEEQFKLSRRAGYRLSLAFVDLDGMKRINDELGPEAGDHALRTTGRMLKATFRASDVLARLGGDEFVVLAIAAGEAFSRGVHKRLLRALADHNRTAGGIPLSFSVGFSHYNPLSSRHATFVEVMREADQAMYLEKQTRRQSRRFAGDRARKIARSDRCRASGDPPDESRRTPVRRQTMPPLTRAT